MKFHSSCLVTHLNNLPKHQRKIVSLLTTEVNALKITLATEDHTITS